MSVDGLTDEDLSMRLWADAQNVCFRIALCQCYDAAHGIGSRCGGALEHSPRKRKTPAGRPGFL